MTQLTPLNVGGCHCGACGLVLVRAGRRWFHELVAARYIAHDPEPIADV